MIIDSHCHLDFDILRNNIGEILKRANKVGVKFLLTICTENKSFIKIIDILEKHKNIFFTYGIHPHEAKNYDALTIIIKIQILNNKKKVLLNIFRQAKKLPKLWLFILGMPKMILMIFCLMKLKIRNLKF